MQPYFFPYVGYFSLFDAADEFVVYDDVNYIKKGWVNRNYFLNTCSAQRYTLPISKASQNTKICELQLHCQHLNQVHFFKFLSFSYAKAPYFKEVMALLSDVFCTKTDMLADFLMNGLVAVNDYVNIRCNLLRSSQIALAQDCKGEERIINITKNLEAASYINAVGGLDLYSAKKFERNGINLRFLKHKGSAYRQFRGQHIPNLSILDVLMFNSPNEALEIIKNYELIDG